MIPSITHHRSFGGGPKGRVNYALSEGRDRTGNLKELEPGREPRWDILGARGFEFEVTDRESALRAAAEMDRLAGDRGFSNKGWTKDGPVMEMSMAWHPVEDERTNEHMLHAADSAAEALGMRDAQRLIIRHNEKGHPHLHLIANRIHPVTRQVFPWRNDRIIMREWSKAYELQHGLVRDREYVMAREAERTLQRAMIADARAPSRLWLKTPEQYRAMEDEDERGLAPLERDEVRALQKEYSQEPARRYERGYPHRHYERERAMVPPEVTEVGAPPREMADERGGLSIPNPIGNPFAKHINRVFSDDESHLAQEKGLDAQETAIVRMKRTHERGGRERSPWFDDGGASGQSGFSGE